MKIADKPQQRGLEINETGKNKNGKKWLYHVRAEINLRLSGMVTRLRLVENSISERKGTESTIAGMRNLIVIACALGA